MNKKESMEKRLRRRKCMECHHCGSEALPCGVGWYCTGKDCGAIYNHISFIRFGHFSKPMTKEKKKELEKRVDEEIKEEMKT